MTNPKPDLDLDALEAMTNEADHWVGVSKDELRALIERARQAENYRIQAEQLANAHRDMQETAASLRAQLAEANTWRKAANKIAFEAQEMAKENAERADKAEAERDEARHHLAITKLNEATCLREIDRLSAELEAVKAERNAAIRELSAQGKATGQAQAEGDRLRALIEKAVDVLGRISDYMPEQTMTGKVAREALATLTAAIGNGEGA